MSTLSLTSPAVELEKAACPLGCGAGDDFVLNGRDRLHELPGTFRVVSCRGCGLLRQDPRPTARSIGFYYPATYAPHAATRARMESPPAWKRAIARLVQFNTDRLPSIAPGRAL